MQNVLACIDSSAYAMSVCELAGWASAKLQSPIELLHVVQRKDPQGERHDLSGAIGLGVKSDLLEELIKLEETDARLQIERGRVLLAGAEQRLRDAGAVDVRTVHRHGGIVETILEREEEARVVVIGKRGASHAFATDHIGSKIERVVRASNKPILIAPGKVQEPRTALLAYDGSPAASRALERCVNSPLLSDMPVHVVIVGPDESRHRAIEEEALKALPDRDVKFTRREGRPEEVIADVASTIQAGIVVMGAYGHSPLRNLIVGSTTTAVMRMVHEPVLLVR